MLYALYVGFVSVFAAIAALGHALLLIAVFPNLFGTPVDDMADAQGRTARNRLPAKSKIGRLGSVNGPVFAGHRVALQFRQRLA